MEMTRTWIFIAALAVASGFVSAAVASERHKSARAKDFYARASDEVFSDATSSIQAARTDCFVSYTPVEATRGIRHWTGKCH
jgi:hypothetical protein